MESIPLPRAFKLKIFAVIRLPLIIKTKGEKKMEVYTNKATGKKFYVFEKSESYGESIKAVAARLKVNKDKLIALDGWTDNDKLYFKPWKGFKSVIVIAQEDRKLDKVLKEAMA